MKYVLLFKLIKFQTVYIWKDKLRLAAVNMQNAQIYLSGSQGFEKFVVKVALENF